jgi:hypothetical protein
MTFARDRFIASHMRTVRIMPAAPTSVPLTMRAVLSSTNPAAAAARPEYEFRSDTTTGMSAPPMGMTSRKPSRRAVAPRPRAARIIGRASVGKASAYATITPNATPAPTSRRPVSTRRPGKEMGLPVIQPLSLPLAMMLPEKVTVPMRIESAMVTAVTAPNPYTSPLAYWASSAPDTSAEASPPNPLNTATSSGMAVISTVRASATPISPPRASPPRIRGHDRISCRKRVATTATSMPREASALPVRAVRATACA